MIRSIEEFACAFHAARCVSTPLVAVRTADPASTTHFVIEALKQGTIAGAALDVFAQEPLPADSPLRKLHNLRLCL